MSVFTRLIHGPLPVTTAPGETIDLTVDRATLAKRRWRGCAEDGVAFGFDLERPLQHGAAFHEDEGRVYVIAQRHESVLRLEPATPRELARVAWQIGNLHFPMMLSDQRLFVEDDPAVRRMLEREHVLFTSDLVVFEPISAAAGHHHHHSDAL